MVKMIKKKEEKDNDKELMKDSKKKITKANEDMKKDKDLKEASNNAKKVVAQIKKSTEGVKKKI